LWLSSQGDIWAETTFFGLRWKYLALMEGNVYDITEWANCQKGPTALAHLVPNSHVVQYRIVLGGQANSNQQPQSSQQPERDRFKKEPGTAAPGW
jgi:DnaJ homolog subfamily C member 14